MKTSGEASSRATEQTPEAIGDGVGAKASSDHETKPSSPVRDVLRILHGARSLPPADAIEALQPFLTTMRDRAVGSGRLADASTAAVSALVQGLRAEGVASDDLWEQAIEMCVSFANEASECT